MPASFPILFSLLVVIPGVLIPLYVIVRMKHMLIDERRNGADKMIARGTMVAMVVLIAFSVYAAQAIYATLEAIASP